MFTEKSSAQPIGAVFENGIASPALTRSRRRSWPASLSLGSLADPILRCTLNAAPVPALMTRYRSAPLRGNSIFHAMYPRWCRHTATEANAAMTAAKAAIQLGTTFQSTPAYNYAPGWDPCRGRRSMSPVAHADVDCSVQTRAASADGLLMTIIGSLDPRSQGRME